LIDKVVEITKRELILSTNNTRQGYVLLNTLKLAGYLFLTLKKHNKNKGLA
jgi:hypothetical protein